MCLVGISLPLADSFRILLPFRFLRGVTVFKVPVAATSAVQMADHVVDGVTLTELKEAQRSYGASGPDCEHAEEDEAGGKAPGSAQDDPLLTGSLTKAVKSKELSPARGQMDEEGNIESRLETQAACPAAADSSTSASGLCCLPDTSITNSQSRVRERWRRDENQNLIHGADQLAVDATRQAGLGCDMEHADVSNTQRERESERVGLQLNHPSVRPSVRHSGPPHGAVKLDVRPLSPSTPVVGEVKRKCYVQDPLQTERVTARPQEPPWCLSHDRLSRLDSGGLGDGTTEKPLGRVGSYTRRETRLASLSKQEEGSGTGDYKKMYETALHENDKLKSRLRDSKQELAKIRSQLDKVTQKQDRMSERSSALESDKREKQALEKRVSDMEEELKVSHTKCGQM
ncbi:Protein phosphatase 1 regulatory subunit 12B [Merluccius polli]|uniref:Protein phosphatase 1 regulatory subunit 12B n=1 Tax=Merluccius polli TaxID=89951 RepID=A0AA47NCS4_MERPO|nr:Protein phosphatase 1 regulatory subunit 12B [Merluccius polli]